MTKPFSFLNRPAAIRIMAALYNRSRLTTEQLTEASGLSPTHALRLRDELVDLGLVQVQDEREGLAGYRVHTLTKKGESIGQLAATALATAQRMDDRLRD